MRSLIRNTTLFAAGIVVGAFLMQPSAAQQKQSTGLRLSHVGIYAKDYDESMRFYTQTIGLKEAFTIKDAAGKPTLIYLQITKKKVQQNLCVVKIDLSELLPNVPPGSSAKVKKP